MCKSKHTPDPWEYKNMSVDRNGNFIADGLIGSNNEEPIKAGRCEWEGVLIFNSKADADLIVEAPKLLKACKYLLSEVKKSKEWQGGMSKIIINGIEQIIAKAEGSKDGTY